MTRPPEAPKAVIRVLVADDHPLTRLGIRHALDQGFEVCAEVGCADSAVTAALRERPDICLLDVAMPGGGIRTAARIAAELPGVAVVMISADEGHDTLIAALRAGAIGYLSKDQAFTRLPEILRGVLDGEVALSRVSVAGLLGEFRQRGHVRHHPRRIGANLTSRETDVLELLLEGLSTAEVGRRLSMAPPTVRSHVAALMRKYAVSDREALLALFDDSGRHRTDNPEGPKVPH